MFYPLLRRLAFTLDPETAHRLSIAALELLQAGQAKPAPALTHPLLTQDLWGIRFPNPVGLAAGYDKNAELPLVWSRLGFGFAELGTLTAHAQPGNPRPRIFRLPRHGALINRLGFNNAGADAAATRLARRLPGRLGRPVPLGFNLGKSRTTQIEAAADDYCRSCAAVFPFADYLVVNVSSPNTPELRTLQEPDRLAHLLEAILTRIRGLARAANTTPTPLLAKIAPDLTDRQIVEIVRLARDVGVAGLIATNTTVERPGLGSASHEAGGLSGRPLAARATEVVRLVYRVSEGALPIIGVGGIFSAEDAYERIRAGASLIQIYTGMVYEGPFLARRIVRGLIRLLEKEGVSHLTRVVGSGA